jgi:hypothetical protein
VWESKQVKQRSAIPLFTGIRHVTCGLNEKMEVLRKSTKASVRTANVPSWVQVNQEKTSYPTASVEQTWILCGWDWPGRLPHGFTSAKWNRTSLTQKDVHKSNNIFSFFKSKLSFVCYYSMFGRPRTIEYRARALQISVRIYLHSYYRIRVVHFAI